MQTQIAKLIDIRFHGRAGQGVVTASRFLGEAAIEADKWIHAFPNFGPERMGAPVEAFTRISNEKFTIKTQVYFPDYIVFIDPTLIPNMEYYNGLEEGGTVIFNTKQVPENILELLKQKHAKIWTVDGDTISRKHLGRTRANTVMLGGLIKATGVVDIDHLIKVMYKKFKGEVGDKNAAAIKEAFEEVKQIEY
ncbi:MAG: 2-oxoacid:acceptor oxidoreductase family protein [Candidatus Kariarchaeaceae archaeon]|jgi:pyruvate ferredoxin oxidoreductase gamma subunit/2-oxoisovalerate ferredoxin oxidoreductase gamma subunit